MLKFIRITIIIKLLFFSLMYSLSFKCFGSEKHEFLGVLKLNGKFEYAISYKLILTENNGVIEGYSVTDMSGANETKSAIKGTYNKKNKVLRYSETNIIYTKSIITKNDFCYVHFNGRLNLKERKGNIKGAFKGLYPDSSKCIDGTIDLMGSAKLLNKITKISKKVDKTKRNRLDAQQKGVIKNVLDTLKINYLVSNEDLKIFWKKGIAIISISDPQKEDGDKFDVFFNDSLILKDVEVLSVPLKFSLKISGESNKLKFVAKNTGTIASATMKVVLFNNNKRLELIAKLKKGEKAYITFL